MARDPAFREAVAWQSRESLTRAVDKLANGAAGSPSRARRWTDVVSSYWQRYCSKNDTIGFFGPLAWGTFGDELAFRSGALERERVVHFETWAMEAVATAAGIDAPLPMGPFPERALRPLLADPSGLDRLEVAREAVPRLRAPASPPPSTSSTASSRPSPAGPPRAARATPAAAARSPTSTACASWI